MTRSLLCEKVGEVFFVSLSHDIGVESVLYLLFSTSAGRMVFGGAGLGRLAAQPRVWKDRRSETRLKWRCSLVDTRGIRTSYCVYFEGGILRLSKLLIFEPSKL